MLYAQPEGVGVAFCYTQDTLLLTPEIALSGFVSGRGGGLTFRQSSGSPGQFASLQVRNFGEVLYVIDGVVSRAEEFNTLSPHDIESFTIIKDASAAALFGQSGASGAVLVRTKSPGRKRGTEVFADVRYGLQQYTRIPDAMNPFQAVYASDMGKINLGQVSDPEELARMRMALEDYMEEKDTRLSYSPAQLMSATTSVSGNIGKFSFNTGLSYLGHDALGQATALRRVTLRSGFRYEPTTRLKLNLTSIESFSGNTFFNSFLNKLSVTYNLPVEGLTLNGYGAYDYLRPGEVSSYAASRMLSAGTHLAYNRSLRSIFFNAAAGLDYRDLNVDAGSSRLLSAFARATADFGGKYYLSASIRAEAGQGFERLILPYLYAAWHPYGDKLNDRLSLSASFGRITSRSWIADAGLDLSLASKKVTLAAHTFLKMGDILVPGIDFSGAAQGGSSRVKWNISANVCFAQPLSGSPVPFGYDLWMYQVINQFQNQAEIDVYTVNIDGKNNATLLPGDLKIKDHNRDGIINSYDMRPLGYAGASNGDGAAPNPYLSGNLNLSLVAGRFSVRAQLTAGAMYSWYPGWLQDATARYALTSLDVWHKVNIYDVESEWTSGTFPALRAGQSLSGLLMNNFYAVNVGYLRLREICIGYTFPTRKRGVSIYLSGNNLFSIDNLAQAYGADPESSSDPLSFGGPYKSVQLGLQLSL